MPRLKSRRTLSIACAAMLIEGCASVGHRQVDDLYGLPVGATPARTYLASFQEVREAARFGLERTGLENIEEHGADDSFWYITGEVGYSWRSNGQFVRVAARVDSASVPTRTFVFYASLRRYEVNITEDLGVVREKILNLMDNYIESL